MNYLTYGSSLDILVLLLCGVGGLAVGSSLPDLYGLLVLFIAELLRGELNLSWFFWDSGVVRVLDVLFLRSGDEDVSGLSVSFSHGNVVVARLFCVTSWADLRYTGRR